MNNNRPTDRFDEVAREVSKQKRPVKFWIKTIRFDWDIWLVRAIKKLFKGIRHRRTKEDDDYPLGI